MNIAIVFIPKTVYLPYCTLSLIASLSRAIEVKSLPSFPGAPVAPAAPGAPGWPDLPSLPSAP